MTMLRFAALACGGIVSLFLLAACGDDPAPVNQPDGSTDSDSDSDTDADTDTDVDTDTDADTDSDTDSDTDTDTDWSGDCDGAEDCPDGDCLLVPDEAGGWWTCVYPPPAEADGASENPEMDGCDAPGDCPGDGCGCFEVAEVYPGFYAPHNECLCDECDTDADCPEPASQQCIPAGAFGLFVSTCVRTECKINGDCALEAGGICAPYYDDLCSSVEPPPYLGKGCHYPDDPCEPGGECPIEFQTCAPSEENTGFVCQEWACPG